MLTAAMLSLFLLLLIFQFHIQKQQEFPLNTTDSFTISMYISEAEKDSLIQELNSLVDKYNGVLLKVVPGKDDYEKQKDIIWFGTEQQTGTELNDEGHTVKWLSSKLYGEMIQSDEMGVRPLYGTYAMRGDENFKNALNTWADGYGFSLSWHNHIPLHAIIFRFVVYAGIGSACITALLLFLTTVVVWYVSKARARASDL